MSTDCSVKSLSKDPSCGARAGKEEVREEFFTD